MSKFLLLFLIINLSLGDAYLQLGQVGKGRNVCEECFVFGRLPHTLAGAYHYLVSVGKEAVKSMLMALLLSKRSLIRCKK